MSGNITERKEEDVSIIYSLDHREKYYTGRQRGNSKGGWIEREWLCTLDVGFLAEFLSTLSTERVLPADAVCDIIS